MQTQPLWPLLVYFLAAVGLTAGMIVLSALLGERHREKATGQTFESGIVSTGTATIRFSPQFYLVALFFVIFDLESVFIFAWAYDAIELGWAGYIEMLIFVVVLLAALTYLWRDGALDWGTSRRRNPTSSAR